MSFPLSRKSERTFPSDFDGEVFVCDIDRTYLATRFSSLSGLMRIPFEFAIDKRDIAGMVPLLKEVRRGPEATSRHTPLYFISASPRQLRPVIERKMLLDGLEYDGTTFKDWGRSLVALRPGRLREQLGFKLTALLLGRQELPARAREALIGDDLECDPLVFALYADLLARRIREVDIVPLLVAHGVAADDAQGVRRIARLLPGPLAVSRALVRLERSDSPSAFLELAPGVVACQSPLEMAAVLCEGGSIAPRAVVRVAREMLARGASPSRIGDELCDCRARALVGRDTAEALRDELVTAGVLPSRTELCEPDVAWAAAMARARDEPWTPPRLLAGVQTLAGG